MKTSRQQVYDYVITHRLVSSAEISRALRMTQANARHHLGILESEGLVRVNGLRQDSARGRPVQLYSPSEGALGHNLDCLASALLEELLEEAGLAQQEILLRKAARRMARRSLGVRSVDIPGQVSSKASLPQRLYTTVAVLNDLHYQARWEARADAPSINLGHCPYAAILENHPRICQLDELFIGELLGQPVRQAARLKPDGRGIPYCLFSVLPG